MLKHLKAQQGWNEKGLAAKGFTLIELLVVIIILGILAAVAIFAIGSIRKDAEKNACKTEIGTVETAIAASMTAKDGAWSKPSGDITTTALPNLRKTPEYVTNWSQVDNNGVVTENCENL